MSVDYASRLLLKIAPVDRAKAKCMSYGLLLANSMIYQTGYFKFSKKIIY